MKGIKLFLLRKGKLCLREKEKRLLKFEKTSCMPAIAELDKKINPYLPQLSRKQKEAVLNVVKTFAKEETDHWKDENFVAEMKRRASELESGKVKGKSWEEV
jgi:hypothetical protein